MFLAVLLLFLSAGAWASCGSASCPVDTRSWQEHEKGLVRLAYDFEYIDQNQPRIGTHKASVGEIPGHHDEQRTINRLHRLTATLGVTNRLDLDVLVPLVSRSHRHVHNHHGTPIPDGWDFSEMGDVAARLRYALYKPETRSRPTVSVIGGFEAPTGKSEIRNADGDEAEPGITPGSDSWDFLAGLATLQHFSVPMPVGEHGWMPLFFSVTQQWNGQGHEHYRLGGVFTANAGVVYPVLSKLGFIAQVNALIKGKDDKGSTSEETEKTGGQYVYLTPGLQVRPVEALELSILAQLPVYQHVNEIQLTSDYNLLLQAAYRFHL